MRNIAYCGKLCHYVRLLFSFQSLYAHIANGNKRNVSYRVEARLELVGFRLSVYVNRANESLAVSMIGVDGSSNKLSCIMC